MEDHRRFSAGRCQRKAVWDIQKLTDEQKADVCGTNSWFGEEIWAGRGVRRIDERLILDMISGKRVVDMARRIIVSDEALAEASKIVANRVPVVPVRSFGNSP